MAKITLALSSRNHFWSSKLHYDFLSASCSSDVLLLPAYLQYVLVTILLLPHALCLLVLAVLMAENAGPLSCGLCHMCCCARHARLFRSVCHLLLLMLWYTSSADAFSCSQGPYVFSVSFNVCTLTPCSSSEVCAYFLCCPALKVQI